MYEPNNLVDAIFVKNALREQINDVQEQINNLEAYGVTEGPKHQELLIKLGELVTDLDRHSM